MAIIYRCVNCGREVDLGDPATSLFGECDGISPVAGVVLGFHAYIRAEIKTRTMFRPSGQGSGGRRPMYSLREVIPGWCPVCRQCWSTDPRLECDYTRAQPDDDAQAAAAYRLSAAIREAKFKADALDAGRRRAAALQRRQQRQGTVVPIIRASARRRPDASRAR